jgi:hypothetical protein
MPSNDTNATAPEHVGSTAELCRAVEQYATICAGVAREECRGEKARPDYQAREAARAAYIQAIEDAVDRIRATLLVEGECPAKLRDAIAQRVADLAKPLRHNTPINGERSESAA